MSAALGRRVVPAAWVDVCALAAIAPGTGVCAIVGGEQVAIVRVHADEVYALDNFDPFSRAFVLSRGIVGDRQGAPIIASPIYKQAFALRDGRCLDDASVQLRVWRARVRQGRVEVELP